VSVKLAEKQEQQQWNCWPVFSVEEAIRKDLQTFWEWLQLLFTHPAYLR